MSATLQRLEQLLSRVQARRNMPRASAAPALRAAAEPTHTQAPTSPFSSPPPGTGRVSKVPVSTPLEESMEQVVPIQRARETQPNPFAAKPAPAPAPDSEDLFLDDFEAPPTIVPAAFSPKPAPVAMPPAAPVPAAPRAPAFEPEPATGRGPVVASAPITAATARIAAAPMSAASPVAAVSKARSIEPKNFGELLDLSLALRPAQ